jgi:hypothetical protein
MSIYAGQYQPLLRSLAHRLAVTCSRGVSSDALLQATDLDATKLNPEQLEVRRLFPVQSDLISKLFAAFDAGNCSTMLSLCLSFAEPGLRAQH